MEAERAGLGCRPEDGLGLRVFYFDGALFLDLSHLFFYSKAIGFRV